MNSADLIVRAYANKSGDQWQAFCIDFCLAAQGDTPQEAKEKLINMIAEYLYDAMEGEDRDYADQLLTRKAPFKQVFTYYLYKALFKLHLLKSNAHMLLNSVIPLVPRQYAD